MEHKELFLVPYIIRCYHSNQFVKGYSRFSDVIVHMIPYNEILKELQKENLTQYL